MKIASLLIPRSVAVSVVCFSVFACQQSGDDVKRGGTRTLPAGEGLVFDEGTGLLEADFGLDDGQVAPGELVAELMSRIDALEQTDCPSGYEQVTTSDDFSLCIRGDDEMVKVGDCWVDRFEASVWQSAECTGDQYGINSDDYPAAFPDDGSIATAEAKVFACSKIGVTPSREISWHQAIQACAASGKHLITDPEWQAAAAGTADPADNDGTLNTMCNTASTGPRVSGLAGEVPASNNSCSSIHGVEDMIGNLSEWVAASSAVTDTWQSPLVAVRGGSWQDGADAGMSTLKMVSDPLESDSSRGFRCARIR